MNKAKFILIVVAIIAFAGGVLAFKVNRPAATELWTLNGQFTTYTTFINGRTYSTVLAICVRDHKWPSTTGPAADLLSTTLGVVTFYYKTLVPPTTYTTFVVMVVCEDIHTSYTTVEP